MGIWSKTVLDRVQLDSPIDQSRFVAARTETPIGPVLILGVCVPWHMAEVKGTGGRKAKPWQHHLEYLEHLGKLMASLDEPFVVAGDFNQRFPRVKYANRAAADAMEQTFAEVSIVTAGVLDGCALPGIDHIALSSQLTAVRVAGWRNDVTGNRMSDHDGAWVDVVG